MAELLDQIQEHAEGLEDIAVEIDWINEQAEAKTAEAREGLARYRQLKHESALALQEVAIGYRNAQSIYKKCESLTEKLQIAIDENARLNRIIKTRSNGEELIALRRAGRRLWWLYEQVQNMQAESLVAVDS